MIGVTGATGRLGGRVARRLAAAGVEQRLIVRSPERAPQLPGATVAVTEYADGAAATEALRGLDTLLMVSGAESAERMHHHRTFVDAAVAAGVGQLVYTSFVGAGPDATFTLVRDHGATEAYIEASGLPHTFLRDNLYADFFPLMVGDDGVLRGPGGQGRVAAVVQDDIADVITAVLLDPAAHAGRTHDLTGPQALTLDEVAATITEITGRRVTYYDETLDEAYESRRRYGAPDWQLDAWVSTYTAIAAGELAAVSDAIETITGRPATSFADLLRRESS